MADNYLEKRYDEVFNQPRTRVKHVGHTVDELLLRNRSYRGYHKAYKVSEEMLRRIVAVNCRIGSARNQQVLRYRLVTAGDEAEMVMSHCKMGAALPELRLPFAGSEPEAFVVVCTTVATNPMVYIDLGISLQSMLIKATEQGLGGLVIASFNHAAIKEGLALELEPLIVLAIGKPEEKIELVPIHEGDSHNYYRLDGVHYVPKLTVDKLIIKKVEDLTAV